MSEPTVIAIYISPSQGEPMIHRQDVQAVENRGLEGDRYFLGKGYYSGDKVWDANVTLIEEEAHTAANEGADELFATDCLRRNIVTRGIDLKSLIGREFSIGTAVLRGTKVWPPCSYISGMHPGRDVLKRFSKSAGIGATVIRTGKIGSGDSIQLFGEADNEPAS